MDASAFEGSLEDACERQAMQAADIEAECCRECAPVAAAASEETETAAGVHSAQAPRCVAGAPVIYGIQSIMDGSALDDDAQAAISSEMENEDAEPWSGTTHAPRRSSRRMPDEAELQRLQQEQQERRRRTDMLSHLRLCPHRPRKHSFENGWRVQSD